MTVKPGVYQHYKGNLYRVLFGAEWCGETPTTDALCSVFVAGIESDASPTRAVGVARAGASWGLPLFEARWSGNTNSVKPYQHVVVYVSLSDSGRVSIRTVKEFEETVRVPCKEWRGEFHDVPRFRGVS